MLEDPGLLHGTLDVLILKTLSWGPRHGYGIAQWLKEGSRSALSIEDRALYLSLHRMHDRGWIESEWGLSANNRRAKFYILTPAGRQQLLAKTAHWTRYAAIVSVLLSTTRAELSP